MKYSADTIYAAKQRAIAVLTTPFTQTVTLDAEGKPTQGEPKPNKYYVDPYKNTSPVALIQEQPFTNANGNYTFDFTWNAPPKDATHNNVVLPKNNVVAIYGIRVLYGRGDTAITREYHASGFTTVDDCLYNSQLSMKIESDTPVAMIEGQFFRNVYGSPLEYDDTSGLVLLDPVRVLSGEMGTFEVKIDLKNSPTGLVITPSSWVRVELLCVMGQASAQAKK